MHIEFFNQPGNLTRDHVMVVRDGHYSLLREADDQTIRVLFLRLLESPEAIEVLHKLKKHGITNPKDQIRQFAMCNFGKLDRIDDLDEEGKLHFEFVNCPYRNKGCSFNSEFCIRKY